MRWFAVVSFIVFTACGPAKAPTAMERQAQGEWMPTNIDPAKRRLLIIAAAAVADPPNSADLDRIHATDAERKMFDDVVKVRRTQPDSPGVKKAQDAIAGIEGTKIEITADEIVVINAVNHERIGHHYTVERETPTSLTIVAQHEEITLRFQDADHASMISDAGTIPIVRKRLFWTELMK